MNPDTGTPLLEESPDAIFVTTSEGTVVYWNRGAEATFGYSSGEAIGRPIFDLIVPHDRLEQAREIVRNTLESGLATHEALRRRKDGSLIYVDITGKARRNPQGGLADLLFSEKDVTQLRVMRDAKLIEARFRDLLESSPDGILMVNATGRIVLANSQAETLFGYLPGELRGRPIETLLPEKLRNSHVGHRARYHVQPRVRTMGAGLELHGLRKDGTEFPVEISLSPLQTDEGAVVMSAVRDISARRKAEQKFKDLLEAAPDAIIIVGNDGRMVLVNSQTEKLFGFVREELLGQKIEMLLPDRYRQKHPSHRNGFFTDPRVRPMGVGLELFGQRKDGAEFPVEISLSPIQTEEGTLVSSAIRDITERKNVERALQDKNIELANANQAKDRFLASMSHELRTPLNAIIGFTGTLLMGLPGPLNEDQEKQLKTVQASGHHLLALINDLLDLAKIEAGKVELFLEPTDCREVVEEVLATLRPQAENKGLSLSGRMPAGPLTLQTDRRALSQILINLTGNAIKFTEKGSVTVTLEERNSEAGRLVSVSVADTGVGIRPGDQEKLFQAFTQMSSPEKPRPQGTGLGLHLSRKLAELMGGSISFHSEYGKGSTFTLSLGNA